jgi:hypothetical protein
MVLIHFKASEGEHFLYETKTDERWDHVTHDLIAIHNLRLTIARLAANVQVSFLFVLV